ncbi:hypothetical protein AB0395_21820 [Streptosporangium sp. NPDC051023]|uniref:hypothetical protein n=1 Tax=Streptosporangium sp. NPDC051023 TaxID=3155410 RepID=UPI00344F69DD
MSPEQQEREYLPVHRDPSEVILPPLVGTIIDGRAFRRPAAPGARDEFAVRLAEIYERTARIMHGEVAPLETVEAPVPSAHDEIMALRRRINMDVWRRMVTEWPNGDYRDATMDSLDDEQGVREVRAWLAAPTARTLVLGGDVGRGKTHTAFAALRVLAERGLRVCAVDETRYLAALQPGGSDLLPYKVREAVEQADAVLLDDFGAGRDVNKPVTEFVCKEIGSLLSNRLGTDRFLIVTSNYDPEQLGAMYGPRIISRLAQQAAGVYVKGIDRRPYVLPKTWGGRPATAVG